MNTRVLLKSAAEAILKNQSRERYEGSLIDFAEYVWPVVEPAIPFIRGWAIEAIAEHLEAVTKGHIRRLLMNVPPGFTKACDINTLVLTTGGWKKHGDLFIGDFVFGPDGKPKMVTGRTPNVLEPAYRIGFDDGAEAVVGAGHLWQVERDIPNQNKAKRGSWKRISCVVETPDLRVGNPNASRRCADRIVISNPIDLPDAILPIDPYTLGCWLGDGDSRSGILYAGEMDVAHFLNLGHRVASTNTVNRISIDNLAPRLRELGLIKNKHIPDIYIRASESQRWALLQGLMDTDGQVSPEGWCRFTTGKSSLANGMMVLASSLGIKPRLSKPFFDKSKTAKKIGPYYRIRFTPPSGSPIFRLDRKQSRLKGKNPTRGIGSRYVVSVTPIESRFVNCIQVDGGLYLITDRFIVTHNSLLTDVMWPAWEWGPPMSHRFRPHPYQ